MITLSGFLNLLEGVRRTGKEYTALCPAHDDHSPSLSVSETEDGRILVHCHAGCDAVNVCKSI